MNQDFSCCACPKCLAIFGLDIPPENHGDIVEVVCPNCHTQFRMTAISCRLSKDLLDKFLVAANEAINGSKEVNIAKEALKSAGLHLSWEITAGVLVNIISANKANETPVVKPRVEGGEVKFSAHDRKMARQAHIKLD